MGMIASQITSLASVYLTFYSGADQRKHQSSASLAFVRGIHWWPLNSPHKWPVTQKMYPFDDVIILIMQLEGWRVVSFHFLEQIGHIVKESNCIWAMEPGIILCMHPANERRPYNVTSSLIGWAHTQNEHSDWATECIWEWHTPWRVGRWQMCIKLQLYNMKMSIISCGMTNAIHSERKYRTPLLNTLRPRQMAAIFQMTCSNAFSWMKMY